MSWASASRDRRWDSRERISEEAADPPEAILEREERMDSEERRERVSGWQELELELMLILILDELILDELLCRGREGVLLLILLLLLVSSL